MPVASGSRDYYDALGVSRDAGEDDIRRAYRRLARQYHPDVNKEPGAEDRFKQISEAYEVLRDPEKRANYDRFGTAAGPGPDTRGAAGYGQGGNGGAGFEDLRFDFGGGDFDDLFEGLFSGRAGGRRGGRGFSMPGSDYEAVLDLGLHEAAAGGRRWLSLGDGRSVEVDIPRGVRDGQLIRVPGEGAPGSGGGPPGDLILRIRLRPHPDFRVEGGDLYVDLPVAPWEAALGADVPVPTLEGSARVKVPAGSSSGRRLRLRGQGLPANAQAPAGDLYAIVSIRVPKRLSRQERRLFEQLAETSKFDPRKRG